MPFYKTIAWSGLGLDFWEDAEVQTPKRDYKNRCGTHLVTIVGCGKKAFGRYLLVDRWRNLTAEYEQGEAEGERRVRDFELEEKREREDRRKKEEATRRLYEVAQAGKEATREKRKEKKIIGTRFFDPKERRVVDTRRTYLEQEEEEEDEEDYYHEAETEEPKTTSPRPRQRRKQRPKPTEKIYYEEEKIGPEKKNLRFEIKEKPVSQSEEWGSKMWSEIKADEKFGWGEKGVSFCKGTSF